MVGTVNVFECKSKYCSKENNVSRNIKYIIRNIGISIKLNNVIIIDIFNLFNTFCRHVTEFKALILITFLAYL